MTADLLFGLLRANLLAALAVALVFLLRGPVRRAFGARVAYGLWALPLLAGLAVALPQPAAETLPVVAQATAAAGRALPRAATSPDSLQLALWLWLAGALAVAGFTALRQARYVRALGPLRPAPGGVWRAARPDAGPAVVGALRPRIVTPSDFEARFDPAEREVILAHERAHLRTGDTLVNALAAAVQALCWFNPAVHLAARALRIDQELACDAAVLARFPRARRLYGELLLKTQVGGQPLPLGCHWLPGSQHPLKARILMLKSPLPAPGRKLAGLALLTTLAAAIAGAAWASGAGRPLVGDPDWVQRPTADDVKAFYPARAVAEHVEGRALIACQVRADGGLEGCAVLKEDPAAYGFGDAALRMSERFRMTQRSRSGLPTAGADVRIPILFKLPDAG
jgi:TonB family protein